MIAVLLIAAPAAAQEYAVGGGDALEITVYGHDDLATKERVTGEGTIQLPLLGEVKVEGLTAAEISRKIADLLADGYIINPQVRVFVTEYVSRKVVIVGEVNRPGVYEIGRNTRFLELLSKAGGLTKDAAGKAIVRRVSAVGGKEEIIAVDLRRLIEEGDFSQEIAIMDGDSVHIASSGYFYIIGEIKRPDAYKYKEGTSILKAVTLAGGFSDRAATTKVKVIRVIEGKEQVMEDVMMDEPVRPDDLIVVPLSFF